MMGRDPIKNALWGMLVGNIENMGILPALQGGEAIGKALEGKDPLDKLSTLDGADNMEVVEKNGFKYVVLKSCPFKAIYKDIPPWGEKPMKLVETYNKRDDGGGALHPLCLVHKGARNGLKAGIISIACRSEATGKIEVADKSLEKVGLTREEAVGMVEGKGCLYAAKA
jgi:hypothetical protein